MTKVYVESYGCQANHDDGNIMKGILKRDNFDIVENENDADVVVVNTCVVKQTTANKIRNKLSRLYENKKIVITGCMAEAEKEKLRKIYPRASLVNTFNIDKVCDAIELERAEFLDKINLNKLNMLKFENGDKTVIQISQGCTDFCSFCETKLAKGKIQSLDYNSIVNEIRVKKNLGIKYFHLTSTDNGAYGLDYGKDLVFLLNKILEIDGDFKIKIGMMNPWHVRRMLNGLIEVYKNDKIEKFLHIPVQSGSNMILREMRRNHTKEDFINIVHKFRSDFKGISIITDIIFGYPTETEEDFKETLDLIREIKPEVVNLSRFSSRPGTGANKLKQLPTEILKERGKRTMDAVMSYERRVTSVV
ncbi:tRNA (N(6)-L-threonylcarbamoyladenosine(37)-C(2))-methylthiotransferase [Candidatus Woesearchaeota archaeon]|nr:tRNA (N(6)-L-threonylcarbamoyladenosine(37)-C(2))-methylthiotransferase [Candidatus Woesearchaeota archaeon]